MPSENTLLWLISFAATGAIASFVAEFYFLYEGKTFRMLQALVVGWLFFFVFLFSVSML